jgi:hypothetical protein
LRIAGFLDSQFKSFPDHRACNAVRSELADVVKSAFAMFSLKSPSLLDFKKQTIAVAIIAGDARGRNRIGNYSAS